MPLATFIEQNMAMIVSAWEDFARSLYPEGNMSGLQLRDHVTEILAAVMKDLATGQTKAEQSEKSMGRAPTSMGSPETAAQTHAILRAQSGMNIRQLVGEYRALRATVLRLWEDAGALAAGDVQDLIRFNEAIDQAVAESVAFFDEYVERARGLLLGTLGHDMRTPLHAIGMVTTTLPRLTSYQQIVEAAESLRRSTTSIKTLVDELMDFGRTSMGIRLSLQVDQADLAVLFEEELKDHRVAHPDRRIELTVQGNAQGRWDGNRLRQVLRNLVSNACAYGTPGEPVHVSLHGDGSEVRVDVKNRGAAIGKDAAEQLFNPLTRGTEEARAANPEGLGLGLFIVREVVRAHGGEVELQSKAGETVFAVRLPRVTADTD